MNPKLSIFLVLACFVMLSFKVGFDEEKPIGAEATVMYFQDELKLFQQSLEKLNTSIEQISSDTNSVIRARQDLFECRLKYKRIEFFTSYFFPSESHFYNAAAKYEVEEPTLELLEPMGLQQLEAMLFEDELVSNKSLILAQADVLLSSVKDLHKLLYQFQAKDAQVLESLRIELIRMSVLSIAGFDAPFLKSGIKETASATQSMLVVVDPYAKSYSTEGEALITLLKASLSYLNAHPDFDSFNRMEYLTKYALPLQRSLGTLIRKAGLELNTTAYLDYSSDHIYSPNAIRNWSQATGDRPKTELARLGEQLFLDKALSGNLATSCASCHQPENYFNDQLTRSNSVNPDSVLKRNTPSLFYAGRQHSQFWDGRVPDLKSQIHDVIFNPLEMNGSDLQLKNGIINKPAYKPLFASAFPGKEVSKMGALEISEALAAFTAGLNPMSSAFDRYINGDSRAMTEQQVNGFNVFMGKAQCGTCHFPPYFNSLLPPLYNLSEVEILGTPLTDDLDHPKTDPDLGRHNLYNIRYYKQAFKTPTVRNAAKTFPYMHNGSFKSLEKVIEFYNRGGGKGLGLDVPDQTLSSKPLNLSQTEIKNLIQFLESLTDLNEKQKI